MSLRRFALLVALASLATPAAASAGTVGVQDGTLSITAGDGEANALRLAAGDGVVMVSDSVALTAREGCEPAGPDAAHCRMPDSVLVVLADGADSVDAGALSIPVTAQGGADDDMLIGGAAEDRLEGGPGDDRLVGMLGRDRLAGDDGVDIADYSATSDGITVWPLRDGVMATPRDQWSRPPNLDDDAIGEDIERLVFGPGGDTIIMNSFTAQVVEAGDGGDEISAGGGGSVYAGAGDDNVYSMDDSPDGAPPPEGGVLSERSEYIECGPGFDTASSMGDDYIADDCELAYFPTFIGDFPPAWLTDRALREMGWWKMDGATARPVPPERRKRQPDGTIVETTGQDIVVACTPDCRISATVTVTASAARRLRVGRRATVIARTSSTAASVKVTRRLKLTSRARRGLRRVGRVTGLLRIRTVNGEGVTRTIRRGVRISRSGRISSRRPG